MKLRVLLIAVITCVFAGTAMAATPIAPLALSNRSLGGKDLNQYTMGVVGAVGPNNIGLLVKTWGKVTWVDTTDQYFYIDDGAALCDGTKRPDNSLVLGVRVSYGDIASGVTPITPPNVNDFAVVTGISSTTVTDGLVRPNLRVSKGSDIQAFH